ncbi:DUF6527 family protein [Ferrovibrio xuzhouensis]|uniref:DUF6527 family protein n=1 Tax=Ferrovibrio xuzhouensis TaxID=1576914 RepID=A0ABV7VB51_9PROT
MKGIFTRLLDFFLPVRQEEAPRVLEQDASPRRHSRVWKEVPYSSVHQVRNQAESAAVLQSPGVISIIVGETGPKRIQFKCPCGCGEEIRLSVSPRGPRPIWRFHIDAESKLSLYPSVWRASGCRAHFILRHSIASLLLDEPEEGYSV